MPHVLWLGGPPASGKTTVATLLARRHGLRLHRTDTRTWIHRDRALAAGIAHARRWEELPPKQRWARPTDELLAQSLHRERGAMVLDDLRQLPRSPLVVAEGSSLPAAAVTDPSRALWLLPTAVLQSSLLEARSTSDGHRRLYERLRGVIADEARANGVPTLVVDGRDGVAAVLARVEHHFAAAIEAGPRAADRAERRALLREANEAVVAQVRGYHARPWAEGDAELVVQPFLCECGDPGCEVVVPTTVAAGATGPVTGHGEREAGRRAEGV